MSQKKHKTDQAKLEDALELLKIHQEAQKELSEIIWVLLYDIIFIILLSTFLWINWELILKKPSLEIVLNACSSACISSAIFIGFISMIAFFSSIIIPHFFPSKRYSEKQHTIQAFFVCTWIFLLIYLGAQIVFVIRAFI